MMRTVTKNQTIAGTKLESLQPYKSKIKFVSNTGTCIVSKNQIDYIRSESNYSRVRLRDSTEIVCCRTLKELHSKLSPKQFVRVHASYVVNISRIAHINTDYSLITLESQYTIPISRSQKASLKRLIKQLFD